MAFAQLTARESPRDIEVTLRTRAKGNTQFKRRYSQPVDRLKTQILCDQTGVLTVFYSGKDFPAVLRRVVARDDTGKRLVFLTNNPALKP